MTLISLYPIFDWFNVKKGKPLQDNSHSGLNDQKQEITSEAMLQVSSVR